MSDLAAMDRLRRVVASLDRDDLSADWFCRAVQVYEAGAKGGLLLDDVLGLRPGLGGTSWWEQEAAARRDGLIRAIAAKYFITLTSGRRIAQALCKELRRYEGSSWQRHRRFVSAPAVLVDTLHGDLFKLLKNGAPVGDRTVRAALGNQDGLFVAQSSAHRDPQLHEAPNGTGKIENDTAA